MCVHLHRHGHRGELEAEERDGVADEQPPVRADAAAAGRRSACRAPTNSAAPLAHGASRSTTQSPSPRSRRKRSRSCSRLCRPCQNSTVSGTTRSRPSAAAAAPVAVRRTARRRPRPAASSVGPASDDRATAGSPRRRAGSRAAGPRSTPRSRPGRPARPRRTTTHLPVHAGARGRPGWRTGWRRSSRALARVVVGVEDEAPLVVALQQHRPGARAGRPRRRWRATIALGSGRPAATASANQRPNWAGQSAARSASVKPALGVLAPHAGRSSASVLTVCHDVTPRHPSVDAAEMR